MLIPFPCTGSTMKTATSSLPQLRLERVEVAERHPVEAREQRLEARRELRVAVRAERAEREPVEAVVGGDDARALRRCAAELERRLVRLGAGAREEAALDARRRAREQRVGEQPGERGDAHREHPGRVELERFDQRGADAAVVAADVVHPESAEQVEVARSVAVVEVRAFGARPRAVEADRAQNADELRIDRARPEVEVALAGAVEQGPHVHA